MLQSPPQPTLKLAPTVEAKTRRGIQSIEIGSKLLMALAAHGKPMALGELAKAGGITAGKAHPYLVSFLNVGFVTQEAASGRYELGPLALQVGLAKLQQLDPVKEAAPHVSDLAIQTEQSVAVVVWGNAGPVVVRLVEPTHPMHVNLRTGTVMSLSNTATGRLFAAFLPPKVVENFLATDMSRLGLHADPKQHDHKKLEAELAEIRRRGMARTLGEPIPGINAFSAPVFDFEGNIVLAITVMGPLGTFEEAWDGKIAQALRKCCEEISTQLGYGKQRIAV